MKKCDTCFESNADGATNCVICGAVLPVVERPIEEAKELEEDTEELAPASEDMELTTLAEEPVTQPMQLPPAEPLQVPTEEPEDLPPDINAAIEVYHETEKRVVYTHQLTSDITLIGREDPQRDVFPDIDVSKLDGVSAGHVSREHLRVLADAGKFYLYIYRGTTGTQINKDVIPPEKYGTKIEIKVGDRIVLGGKVRMKLVKV